jgi:hypothetical protein
MFFTLFLFVNTAHDQSIDQNGIDVELGSTAIKNQKQDGNFSHLHKKGQVIERHNGHKKFHTAKHISFEVTLATKLLDEAPSIDATSIHTPSAQQEYDYLFYREINPPPPQSC